MPLRLRIPSCYGTPIRCILEVYLYNKLLNLNGNGQSDLLSTITHLEDSNKNSTSQTIREQLFQARQDFGSLLLSQHNKSIQALKAQSYRYGNRAGKFLATQLKKLIIFTIPKQATKYLTQKKL